MTAFSNAPQRNPGERPSRPELAKLKPEDLKNLDPTKEAQPKVGERVKQAAEAAGLQAQLAAPAMVPPVSPDGKPVEAAPKTQGEKLDQMIAEATKVMEDPKATATAKFTAFMTLLGALAAKFKGITKGTLDTPTAAAAKTPEGAKDGKKKPGEGGSDSGKKKWGRSRRGRGEGSGGERDSEGRRGRRGGERGGEDDEERDEDRSDRGTDRGTDRYEVDFERDDPAYVDDLHEAMDKEADYREAKHEELADVRDQRRDLDEEIDDLKHEIKRLRREKKRADRDDRADIQDEIEDLKAKLKDARAEAKDCKAKVRAISTELRLSNAYSKDLRKEQRRRERLLDKHGAQEGKPNVTLEGDTVIAVYPEGTDLSAAQKTLEGPHKEAAAMGADKMTIEGNEVRIKTDYQLWKDQLVRGMMTMLKKLPEAKAEETKVKPTPMPGGDKIEIKKNKLLTDDAGSLDMRKDQIA